MDRFLLKTDLHKNFFNKTLTLRVYDVCRFTAKVYVEYIQGTNHGRRAEDVWSYSLSSFYDIFILDYFRIFRVTKFIKIFLKVEQRRNVYWKLSKIYYDLDVKH